ncbi:MAG TPA: flavin reductase family protein [Gemmatimonadaceae bacterium]|nr:flavin reductase family protein [Gemmatimonadaceae bacterium]
MKGEGAAAALRQLPTGVCLLGILTARAEPYASTVSWVVPLSFEPPMLGVALEPRSKTLALVRAMGDFAISVPRAESRSDVIKLGRSSAEVADKMAGVTLGTTDGGLPIVAGAAGWLACRVVGEQRVGDHVLVIAEVGAGWVADGTAPPAWSYWGGSG